MFDGFYHGKRVFLTGHTGFKGSWLSLWLAMLGAEVRGYALDPPSEPSLFDLAGVGSVVDHVHADIRDLDTLTRSMAEFRPDVVIHMAAQSLVRRSYAQPVDTFAVNVLGTVHVLEAVRTTESVRAVINVTSDKCYENREQQAGYCETDPMGGHDPYSASKGCAELAALAYARSFFHESDTALASVRAGNVIGGGDFAEDRLIPDMARAFSKGEAVHIRSPKAVRPWQHVMEPLSGYLLLARKLFEEGRDVAGGWNFGPADADARTVGEVVQGFAQAWGPDARVEMDQGDHPHEAGYLRLNCTKAFEQLGWTPRTDFTQALDWTAAWYRAWAAGHSDLRGLTGAQIQAWMGAA